MQRSFCLLSLLTIAAIALAAPPAKSTKKTAPAATSTATAAAGPGVWIACGYGGRRMISTDGQTWQITEEWAQPGGDDSNNLMSAVYAEGKFVVVGGGGGGKTAGGHILVSNDGRTWREVLKPTNRVNPVVHGSGRFIAGGPGRQLLWSDDGEQWKPGAKIDDKIATHFRHGAFANGVFVFTGNHGGNGGPFWLATTTDGTKIDHFNADMPPIRALATSGELFVIVNTDGQIFSSADGRQWDKRLEESAAKFTNVVWTGSAFLASGSRPHTSADGKTWQPLPHKLPASVLWSDGKRFIGSSWPGQMWWSVGGVEWKKSDPLPANGINKVVFGR